MAAFYRFAIALTVLLVAVAPASRAQVAEPSETASASPGDQALPDTPKAELAYALAAGVVFTSLGETAPDKVNSSRQLSCDSKMATLLDTPVSREVLERRIPEVVSDPRIFMARGMTLKQLARHRQTGITSEQLSEIDQDLASAYRR